MPSAAHLRQQIEAALASRIPSALTPSPRVICPTAPTGITALDAALGGGFPVGAITELTGPECSGRTSLALSFLACLTNDNRVCAWVDVSDTLHPESAAAAGVDLNRLLWIRCGPEAEQLTLPGMSDKASDAPVEHQRTTVRRDWVATKEQPSFTDRDSPPIRHDYLAPRCCEPVPKVRRPSREKAELSSRPKSEQAQRRENAAEGPFPGLSSVPCALSPAPTAAQRPLAVREYSHLDQALRAADLLLQGGGFSAIVLDLGSIAPEFALRVPLATWFRYRAAAERTQASVLLLTQHSCSKSSAGLVLHCRPGPVDSGAGIPETPVAGAAGWSTVFTGAEYRVEIARDRFTRSGNVVDFDRRKPPQSDHSVLWRSRTPWSTTHPVGHEKAGRR